jgi:hypothetical protein
MEWKKEVKLVRNQAIERGRQAVTENVQRQGESGQ